MSDQKTNANPFMRFFIESLGSTLGKMVAWGLFGVAATVGTMIWLDLSFVTAAIIVAIVGVVLLGFSFFVDIFN